MQSENQVPHDYPSIVNCRAEHPWDRPLVLTDSDPPATENRLICGISEADSGAPPRSDNANGFHRTIESQLG